MGVFGGWALAGRMGDTTRVCDSVSCWLDGSGAEAYAVACHRRSVPTLNEELPMSTTDAARTGAIDDRSEHRRNGRTQPARRLVTETKAAFKTTEFVSYLAVLAGLLIAGVVVDNAGDGGFGASKVWLYATILTVGYMVSRGLAKSGSSQPYDENRS